MQEQPDADGYRAICLAEADPADIDRWLELRQLLVDRRGWHFSYPDEADSGDPCWCLGLLGACRVAVSVGPGRFVIYVYDDDETFLVETVDAVERWLVELDEQRFLELSPLAGELLDAHHRRPTEDG